MRIWTAFIILLCAACTAPPEDARGLALLQPEPRWANGSLEIETALSVDLGPAAIEALEHGVPLTLVITTRTARGPLWFVPRPEIHRHALEIRYLPLSRHWHLHDKTTGDEISFPRLWMLTESLAEPRRIATGLSREALDGRSWKVQIRAELDLNALPSPMRLPARFSPQWRLSSSRHTWHFNSA